MIDDHGAAGRPAAAEDHAAPWLNHYPAGVDWHAPIDDRPLPIRFQEVAARYVLLKKRKSELRQTRWEGNKPERPLLSPDDDGRYERIAMNSSAAGGA